MTCFETWLAYLSCFGLFGVGLTCTAPYSWLRAGHTLLMSPVSLPGFIFFTFFFSTFLLTFVVFLLFYCSYAKEFIYTERLFFSQLITVSDTVGHRNFLRTPAGNFSNEIFSASFWHYYGY